MKIKLKAASKHSDHIFGRPQRGGVALDSTNMNKGREGVKNPENFADVLNGSSLRLLELRTLWRLEAVVDIIRDVQVALTLL